MPRAVDAPVAASRERTSRPTILSRAHPPGRPRLEPAQADWFGAYLKD
jgi:hypothetical protein